MTMLMLIVAPAPCLVTLSNSLPPSTVGEQVRSQPLLRRLPLEGLVYSTQPLDAMPAPLFAQLCRALAVGALSLHEKVREREGGGRRNDMTSLDLASFDLT